MKLLSKITLVCVLPLLAVTAQAQRAQDCIVEGTVKSKNSVEGGTNVYVAFESATPAEKGKRCDLERRGKVAFKEPKNAMIESAPSGSKVRYHYTQEEDREGEWQLMELDIR